MAERRSPSVDAAPRAPTPGEYRYVADDDDAPTRPDGMSDAGLSALVSIYSDACALDRTRLARLVDAWAALGVEDRIILEALAYRLAGRPG